jgi:hypothetical protein
VWILLEKISRLEVEFRLSCWGARVLRGELKQLAYPLAAAFLNLESRPTKSPSRFMLDGGLCIVFFRESVCRGLFSLVLGSCWNKFWVLVNPDGVSL